MRYLCKFVFVILIFGMGIVRPVYSQVLTSQPHIGVEQVPIGDDVYAFLRHLSVRGVIKGFSEAQLPISEFEVVGFLHQADSGKLSNAERELVRKYLQTYAHEPREAVTMFPSDDAKPLFFDGIFTQEDKYLYRWFNDSTKSDLFVNGIGSAEFRHQTDPSSESVMLLNLGGRFSGTLDGHVGYFMQTTNGVELGNQQLALEDPLLSKNNNLRYFSTFFDFTTAELAYNNDWFTGKIAREAVAIGGGYQNDNILLSSDGVPTYDFLSIGAHIGAVRYQAIVGSLVQDTVNYTEPPYPVKYLAVHDLTFGIGKDAELGFTDIMVFTERFELGYLNPFSFLGTVKHGLDDQDHDNGLLGTHARWEIAPGFELRGEGILDDLVANKIGTGYWSNKWAWQFGGMWADAFGIPNLDWEAEWMYIKPYLYSHWDTIGSYSTSGTPLGGQIGPNSISYWTQLRWAPDAKWIVALDGQFIERGENVYDSTGKLLYNAGEDYRVSWIAPTSSYDQSYILNGRRVDIINLTLEIEFEPWRGLTFYIDGTKTFVNYLKEPPVTPGFNLTGLPVSLAPQSFPSTIGAIGIKAFF
jgi:hypothetical protein